MTIKRGEPWAENGPLADGAPVVTTDAALRALVEAARLEQREVGEVGLLGGDLCATLGGLGRLERLATAEAVRAPIDVVRARLDGVDHWFVAHLLAHHSAWQGEAAVAMNAEWVGTWKLGPRAHPNDGLVDVTIGALGWQDRLKARQRATSGTHVPHPRLRVERSGRVEFRLRKPTPVHLDGVRVGRAVHVELTVEPDAFIVVV